MLWMRVLIAACCRSKTHSSFEDREISRVARGKILGTSKQKTRPATATSLEHADRLRRHSELDSAEYWRLNDRILSADAGAAPKLLRPHSASFPVRLSTPTNSYAVTAMQQLQRRELEQKHRLAQSRKQQLQSQVVQIQSLRNKVKSQRSYAQQQRQWQQELDDMETSFQLRQNNEDHVLVTKVTCDGIVLCASSACVNMQIYAQACNYFITLYRCWQVYAGMLKQMHQWKNEEKEQVSERHFLFSRQI
jgi:hypothetical protein